MLAVVNQPRIEIRAEEIPAVLIRFLRDTFGTVRIKKESAKEDDDELVNVFETDWYKSVSKKATPAKSIKHCRELFNLTQAQVAERTGISEQNISAMEGGKKPVTKQIAEKLGKAFSVPPDIFYLYAA